MVVKEAVNDGTTDRIHLWGELDSRAQAFSGANVILSPGRSQDLPVDEFEIGRYRGR